MQPGTYLAILRPLEENLDPLYSLIEITDELLARIDRMRNVISENDLQMLTFSHPIDTFRDLPPRLHVQVENRLDDEEFVALSKAQIKRIRKTCEDANLRSDAIAVTSYHWWPTAHEKYGGICEGPAVYFKDKPLTERDPTAPDEVQEEAAPASP